MFASQWSKTKTKTYIFNCRRNIPTFMLRLESSSEIYKKKNNGINMIFWGAEIPYYFVYVHFIFVVNILLCQRYSLGVTRNAANSAESCWPCPASGPLSAQRAHPESSGQLASLRLHPASPSTRSCGPPHAPWGSAPS